ncbi:hypothetical protein [Tannockella kyphosi]|uniref:hypothetical protein n=1 Tax=Tannockella kyphosi TaxID=2899121 RepID=UPI0020132414|nr:hypothetical protein [Tannockella kyphosi]
MKWIYYYENFYSWAESTQLNRISSLSDFTSVDEIIEIVENSMTKEHLNLLEKH